MFIYADLSKTGHDHFLFNTGYFTVLQRILGKDVTLYCHPSHFNYIRTELDLSEADYQEIYIPAKKKDAGFLFRWVYKNIYDLFILRRILKAARKDKAALVFFAMMPVRSMYYLRFWHKYFFPEQQVVLTYHGEIETWFAEQKDSTQRFHSFIFRKLFSYNNPRLKFFVPNSFIRENLRAEPLFRNKDILSIYHLLHPQKGDGTIVQEQIIFGHIGSTEIRKNSGCFFELAQKVYRPGSAAIFKVAGRYNPVFDGASEKDAVIFSDQSRILERKYFDDEILSVHFSVIFIYRHEYLYRESGTVLESLKFYKPIVGLRHPYLDFLEQQYGQMGIYADTIDGLAVVIRDLLADRETLAAKYREMVENIAYMHSQITLDQLSAQLKAQLEETGVLPA